jgi:chromate transporter
VTTERLGSDATRVSLLRIAREWGRIGVLGVGGPPAHIALLRQLVVARHSWMTAEEFEHAIAAANLLPGPASTQLMIFAAWRLRGWRGALIGGVSFIVPGLILIVGLSMLFFSHHPSRLITGAALAAGTVVPAIAARTAGQLAAPSWRSARAGHAGRRWLLYAAVGVVAALVTPALVVVALVLCGLAEIARDRRGWSVASGLVGVSHGLVLGGLSALAWEAFKVGALSYGGGFVIVPLMQHDVVSTYHWLSGAQFLNAVALGQVTPGPVVLTVAAVGYGAQGLTGAALATVVAFAPSFTFVLGGARHFDRLRHHVGVQAFLRGAGPSVIGAIAASALSLGLLIRHLWQVPVLVAAVIWTMGMRRSNTVALVVAAAVGASLAEIVPL